MKAIVSQADALTALARRLLYSHRQRAKKGAAVLDYGITELLTLIRDHVQCQYCARFIGWDAEIDHRIPIARGGKHVFENLAVVCWRCNLIKGILTDEEFRELLLLLAALNDDARADIEWRLIAGGKRYSSSRERKGV